MNIGCLVSDDFIVALVKERLLNDDHKGGCPLPFLELLTYFNHTEWDRV